jgi:hypothetical protein
MRYSCTHKLWKAIHLTPRGDEVRNVASKHLVGTLFVAVGKATYDDKIVTHHGTLALRNRNGILNFISEPSISQYLFFKTTLATK